MDRRRARRLARWAVFTLLAVLTFSCARPGYLLLSTWLKDRPVADQLPPGFVDDASRLNATHVAEVVDVAADPAAAEDQLRGLLRRARAGGLKVAVSGARHSMGGHAVYPDGIVLNMLPFRRMELDAGRRLLRVGAGARWAEVIPYLDARGLSVGVMQATHDFTVGGSLGVNCHGWQYGRPPVAATVASFRLMRADGEVVRCSRDENAELFALTLGGYGLFGVILDAELRVVDNERYRPEASAVVPPERFADALSDAAAAGDVAMALGRLDVTPGEKTFLRKAALTVFRRAPCPPEEVPALKSPGYATLRRTVLLAEIGSDAGKELRWDLELRAGRHIAGQSFSRNQLLNEDATLFQEHKAERTEILHEYFVPPERLGFFLERMRSAVPAHGADLLHVTVRDVRRDDDTFLRYADRDLLAVVLLFSQARRADAEARMEALTRELVDAALDAGGRYYLCYRLHPTPEQFHRAYPRAREFFRRKRQYDPDEVFQNQFYTKYGRT